MKVQSLRCPECGANLSVDGTLTQCFCQYWGSKIVIYDGSTTHTYREVDEARIKEAEVSAQIRMKELEIEEKKRLAKEKAKATKIKFSIVLGIVGGLLLIIGYMAGNASGNPDSGLYMLSFLGLFALISISFIWGIGDNEKEEK